jgi:hypothetical protein
MGQPACSPPKAHSLTRSEHRGSTDVTCMSSFIDCRVCFQLVLRERNRFQRIL